MARFLAACRVCLSGLLCLYTISFPAWSGTPEIVLQTRVVNLPGKLGHGRLIGQIRLHGILELTATGTAAASLSEFSGLAWDEDEDRLYAVTDQAVLFSFRPVFEQGRLVSLRLHRRVILDTTTGMMDTEGLALLNADNGIRGDSRLVVSFERQPLIAQFGPTGKRLQDETLPPGLTDKPSYRDSNAMLEAVCHDRRLGILTAPESPLSSHGDKVHRIYDLTGQHWRIDDRKGDLVDMVCLGQERVMLLWRILDRLSLSNSTRLSVATLMNPRTNEATRVEEIAQLSGENGFLLDNFEALARHRGNFFFLATDNNNLPLARTLLAYFEWVVPASNRKTPARGLFK